MRKALGKRARQPKGSGEGKIQAGEWIPRERRPKQNRVGDTVLGAFCELEVGRDLTDRRKSSA